MSDIDFDTIDWANVTDAQVEAMVKDGYKRSAIETLRREARLVKDAAEFAKGADHD
jgi:hypothetical protein